MCYKHDQSANFTRAINAHWLWVSMGMLMLVWMIIVSMVVIRFTNLSSTHADENKDSIHHVNPSVDVLSVSFSQEFMHHAHTGSYDGLHVGMAQREAQKMLGEPSSKRTIDDKNVMVYGNIGIHYNKHMVSDMYIIPQQVSTDAFLIVHGPPTFKNDHYWTYDDHNNNAHTIRVYVDNNTVTAIENIPQI